MIEKLDPIGKPDLEPGQASTRIPKLEEAIDKINELVDYLNKHLPDPMRYQSPDALKETPKDSDG